jgi:hypothetical protein
MALTQVQGAMVGPTGFANLSGITFPATQVPSANANTLDDYEEGTWTPSVESDSVVTGTTYSTRTGFYRKVGQLVTVNLRIVINNWGTGGTGSFYISGLPFTCLNMGINMTCGGFYMDNPTMPSGRTWAVPQAISNNSYMTFIASGNAAGATTMTWAQVSAGNDITLGITYFSAT